MKNTEKEYYGVFVKLITTPAMYLMAKNAGMNFIFFDNEHSVFNKTDLHDLMLFGNNIGIPTFVRVNELSKREISQSLDSGATGIMVPMIETAEQAQLLVDYSKYPPIGKRGYAGGANTNYGPSGGHLENMINMNLNTVTIAQIETQLGVENAESIISVEGIDAVIVGPVDLSISLGNVGNIMHPEELKAIDHVVEMCKKYNKPFGIIGTDAILEHYHNDLNYFISAIDSNIIRDGFKKAVNTYKGMGK